MIDINSESDYMQDIKEDQFTKVCESETHIRWRFFTFIYQEKDYECYLDLRSESVEIGVVNLLDL